MTNVTVVIPAYNEGPGFGGRLVSIADAFSIYLSAGYRFRYAIVDDGSNDETWAAAQVFARGRKNVDVIQHPENRGLGSALRTAFHAVETEYAIVLDADLSYAPATGMELLEALLSENADIATASPYMRGGAAINVPPARRMLSRQANRLLSFATAGRCATLTCMVRAYRSSAMKQLLFRSDRMDAIAEMLLYALRKGMRVIEVPATLRWSPERRAMRGRVRLSRIAAQTWATVRLAFIHRPALWLAVPGLFPGLLPIVVAVLLLLRVSPAVLAAGTAATVIVQYSSLAFLAGHVGSVFARKFHHRHSNGLNRRNSNDYGIPPRSA
ncbi:MAG: glycosyltransferase family 2 protein [Candidatus Baltobacteraceae bacterium]